MASGGRLLQRESTAAPLKAKTHIPDYIADCVKKEPAVADSDSKMSSIP